MKKFVSILAVLLCFAMLAMPFVGHAEASQDVLDALEEAIPAKYQTLYMAQAKNLLAQIEVSDEQADQLIAIIDDLKNAMTDQGDSLDDYSKEDQAYFLGKFAEAMEILGLNYRLAEKDKELHENDIVCYVYNADGELLIRLDGDVAADKTDAADNGTVYLVLAGAFLALSGAAFVFTRKRVSAR